MVSTERTVPLAGATANQRSALFASERFLFLAEMLAKYNKPLLVTDIDVECIKNPMVSIPIQRDRRFRERDR